MSLSDEIRAKVDEAERRLDSAEIQRLRLKHAPGDGRSVVDDSGYVLAENIDHDTADVIILGVNGLRAQIEHARDVLERHRSNGHPLDPRCIGCPDDLGGDPAVPIDQCLELLSLAPAWGVSA